MRPDLSDLYVHDNWVCFSKLVYCVQCSTFSVSHLREHKLKHSFQDTQNPICNCGNDVESAIHFFPNCPLYSNEPRRLLNILVKIYHTL